MPKLIYANAKNSDMFYATSASAHDAFFYLEKNGKKYVFLDQREWGFFKEKNKRTELELVLLDPLLQQAAKDKNKTALVNRLALLLLKQYGLFREKIIVPTSFPLDMADFLRKKGIKLVPQNPLFPERLQKTKVEAGQVRENMRRLCRVFDRVEEILSASKIKRTEVWHKNKPLTSELLKQEIGMALEQEGLDDVEGMIVSSGRQAAMPHHSGAGVLLANEAIICDIFPQSRENRYFADMTRTYVKGKPSVQLKKMFLAVQEAQKKAIAAVRPGVRARDVHAVCVKVFLTHGFAVGERGFVHGTGHGLGIDIHEDPYLNQHSAAVLEAGNIFSIEPGLYYPEWGGVRIEDLVLVTKNGRENLTKYPSRFIFP